MYYRIIVYNNVFDREEGKAEQVFIILSMIMAPTNLKTEIKALLTMLLNNNSNFRYHSFKTIMDPVTQQA